MHRRIIPALALTALTITGIAHAATEEAIVTNEPGIEAAQPAPAATEEEYTRKLAAYRKDLAAYEADPGIWTAEVPQAPARPATLAAGRQLTKGDTL
jgi:hypothetical protein